MRQGILSICNFELTFVSISNEIYNCVKNRVKLATAHLGIKTIVTFRFDGGGAESQAFVVEGMGVALEIFDDMELTRINKK